MTRAQLSSEHGSHRSTGSSEFLTRDERAQRCQQLAAQGFLLADIAQVLDEADADADALVAALAHRAISHTEPRRGKLREAVEGALEAALAARGAPPASDDGQPDPRTAAHDQLLRARDLSVPGLCLVMPALGSLADARGVLDPADSAVLTVWGELTGQQPVVVIFEAPDRGLKALAPTPLPTLFGTLEQAAHEVGLDRLALVRSTVPDDGFEGDDEPEGVLEDFSETPALLPEVFAAFAADHALEQSLLPEEHEHKLAMMRETQALSQPPPPPEGEIDDEDGEIDPSRLSAEQVLEHSRRALERALAKDRESAAAAETDEATLESAQEPPSSRRRAHGKGSPEAEHAGAGHDRPRPKVAPPRRPAFPKPDAASLREHVRELGVAHGPQPVRLIEQLYRTRYAPLLEAVSSGLDDEPTRLGLTQWRKGFEKSYGEAYTTIRLTGKRPPMVLDAPEAAAKLGKLNGARTVELLLVDSMRLDLGERVKRLLKQRLAARAACVDESLLWASLPSITPVQLRLLATGPRGLREGDPSSERDPVVQRGRSVTTLRRVRIGQRDLVKLDVVEARLRDAGPPFDQRLGAIAEEVAAVIDKCVQSLPPRTLLYVFGDHGFKLAPSGDEQGSTATRGTGPATQGGSSPEEVLVPAYAWLVGDVH